MHYAYITQCARGLPLGALHHPTTTIEHCNSTHTGVFGSVPPRSAHLQYNGLFNSTKIMGGSSVLFALLTFKLKGSLPGVRLLKQDERKEVTEGLHLPHHSHTLIHEYRNVDQTVDIQVHAIMKSEMHELCCTIATLSGFPELVQPSAKP